MPPPGTAAQARQAVGDAQPRRRGGKRRDAPGAILPVAAVCAGFVVVNAVVATWLLLLGRGVLPDAVPLHVWNASIRAEHNSQHVMDLYSLLHALSGAGLCLALGALRPAWPASLRLLIAIASSGLWEIVENTPFVIAAFNDPAGPYVYSGDSVVNALSDSAFVVAGFLAAGAIPRWWIISLGVVIEVGLAVLIRDGFVFGTARMIWR